MPKGIKGFQTGHNFFGFRGPNHPSWREKITVKCLNCGKEIQYNKSRTTKYCSRKCYIKHYTPWHKNKTDVYSKKTLAKMRSKKLGKLSPIKGKKLPQSSGKNHWNWAGGVINHERYTMVWQPDHPFAIGRNKRYVAEHRLVMEKKIGRYLTKQEVVHHINCQRKDNRIENLMLFPDRRAHGKYHKFLRDIYISKQKMKLVQITNK